jgi:hypothetical protein
MKADSIIFREIREYLDEMPEDALWTEVTKLLFFQCFSLYGETGKNHKLLIGTKPEHNFLIGF